MKKKQTFHGHGRSWSKLFLIMRLTIFLFFAFVVGVQAKSYSQTANLTLNLSKTRLVDVLSEIERQSGYYFYYNLNLDNYTVGSIEVKNKNIKEVLENTLSEFGLTYNLVDRYIIIKQAVSETKGTSEFVIQQQKTISGKVIDSSGSPLPGVSVVVKGTTDGTITDSNGKYSISKVSQNNILQFSFVGMKTQEIVIGGKSEINVKLEDETIGLGEVVAIGYGVQKKSNITGAISSIKAEDLAGSLVSNAASAIQGKVSGVQVVNTSGAPGSAPTIRVRGYSSNGKSDPLFIVDGLKVKDINYLEPSSIKSMEILKDAASAAIYGAEAGNGVILITTKSGNKGQTKVSMDVLYSSSTLASKVDLLNADKYKQYYTEAYGDAFTSLYNQYNIAGTNTDWQDVMYGTGKMQKYNVSVQGGNESGNMFLSLGYMNNDGMVTMDRDFYQRFTGQINSSYKIKPWMEVGTNNTITNVKNSTLSENNVQYGMMKGILVQDPLTPVVYNPNNLPARIQAAVAKGLHPVKDDNGNYYGYSWGDDGMNPLADVQVSDMANRSFFINGMTYVNLKPFKNFVFTSRVGYSLGNYASNSYTPTRLNGFFKDVDTNLDLKASQITSKYYQLENFFNYSIETQKAGNFSVMAGTSYINNEINSVGTQTNGLLSEKPNFLYMDYSTSSANDFVTGNLSYRRQIAYYGRLGWDYMNRYNVQANMRMDSYDSAYLDLEHNWGNFPSVSVGWTFSNENFLKSIMGRVFTYGKLRASYGVNGSISNLGNYMYAATLRTGQYDLTGKTANMAYWLDNQLYQGVYPNSILANPKLRWERSKQMNFGLDLRFFNDRLSTTVDYYNKLTDGLLVQSVAPLVTGAATVYQNLGKVTNNGIELELGWKDKIGDFSYDIKGSFATVKNNVKEFKGEGTRISGSGMLGMSNAMTYFEEGYPLWYIRGYKMTGVNEKTGEPIFADLTGEGEITDADRTNLGKAIPDFTYGLTLSLGYKNFDFSVFGTGASGNKLVYAMMTTDPSSRNNRPNFLYEGRWTSGSTNATLPSAVYQINDPRFYNSDAFVFDASFFKIKQIQLGYTLSKRMLSSIGIESLRTYVLLDNFFTFTKYPGSDPEINASSNTSSAMALDYGGYPIAKSLSFGINVTF
jgi:TonB-linked SusC/RagA family outer membrane protein